MCKSLIALISLISIAWATSGFSDDSLLKLNALGGSLGAGGGSVESDAVEARLEFLSVGIGKSFPNGLGVIVSTKLGESLFSGGFTLASYPSDAASWFPIYLEVTSGLHSRKKLLRPVPYLFAGGSAWAGDGEDYLRLGAGLKWTFWAVSLGGEMSWRGVWNNRRHDRYAVSITLELGGWWAESRKEDTPKEETLTD